MLDQPSARFALAATARVSCCAAVLVSAACRVDEPLAPEQGPDQARSGEANEPGLVVIAEPDPGLEPGAAPPEVGEPSDPERAELERCQAQVSAAIRGDQIPSTDTNLACCQRLSEHAWNSNVAGETAAASSELRERDAAIWNEVRGPCCVALEWNGAGCTPWGPPSPPSAMAPAGGVEPGPRSRLDLRALAREHAPAGVDLAALDGELRAAAIATWRARMVNEHGSARVFEGLAAQLEALALPELLDEATLARVRGFAEEERRHGILCGAVVEALGGRAEGEALPARLFPDHADAGSELEATLRNLLSVCCLSETVAVALIAAERFDMPEGPLRELLTRIWADECGHANFGWRLLPGLLARADAATIAALGEYLRLAFAELEAHELAHLPANFIAPPGGAAYGLCTGAEARALFYAAVERVIVPGLEARGLPARRAWARRQSAKNMRSSSPRSSIASRLAGIAPMTT